MIYKVFSAFDGKSLSYSPPFYSETVGSAARAFSDAVNDGQSMWSKHPGDFQLYEIGTFDGNSGLLTALVPMRLVASALEMYVEKPKFIAGGDMRMGREAVKVAEELQEALNNGKE